MNSWYAMDRLGAAHRADLEHEAARTSLAVSARRGAATVGQRKLFRLPRAARGAAIAVALALVVAAPAAAAQPTKTVLHRTFDSFNAQESGCGFPVSRDFNSGARKTIFDFADGRELTTVNEVRTITNLDNGKTFVERSVGHDIEWLDAAGLVQGQINGQFIVAFYPGDIGPDGSVVQAPGLAYYFTGIAWYTWDPNTGYLSAFSYLGSFVDVCAALS